LLAASSSSLSKVEGDRIIFGATVSLSGKYAISGLITKMGTISLRQGLTKPEVSRLAGDRILSRSSTTTTNRTQLWQPDSPSA